MNFLIAQVWTPSEMATEQQRLLTSAQNTDRSVQACAQVPAATRAEWAAWLAPVVAFCAQVPVLLFETGANDVLTTGTRADQLRNYEAELISWQQRFTAYPGCSFSPGLANAQSGASGDALMSALKWGVVGAGFIASAVVVSKLAETVQLFGPRRAA